MYNRFINKKLEKAICSKKEFDELLKLEQDIPIVISFVNPFSYQLIAERSKLITDIDYWFVDGSLLCKLTNLKRNQKIERISFDYSSIAGDVFLGAQQREFNVALIGATKDEIIVAERNIKTRYPELNIVYSRDGYFKEEEYQQEVDIINKFNCHLLIVGTGTPIQEEFAIHCAQNSSSLKYIYTCGGFLTQTAMKSDYYHPFIKKTGLRWLQRALMHKHVRRRLIKYYPSFIIRYLLNR